jgi:hypothetical protein
MMTEPIIGKALTWNELADIYDTAHPSTIRPARTLRMETVFEWAENQTNKFLVDKEGSIHQILEDS